MNDLRCATGEKSVFRRVKQSHRIPSDLRAVAVTHLATRAPPPRTPFATPRQFCSFLSGGKQLFRPGSLQERKNKVRGVVGAKWGVWGTEIINARLPATPHYSVGRGPLLFGAIASKMLARLKTKDVYRSHPFESCFFARINAVRRRGYTVKILKRDGISSGTLSGEFRQPGFRQFSKQRQGSLKDGVYLYGAEQEDGTKSSGSCKFYFEYVSNTLKRMIHFWKRKATIVSLGKDEGDTYPSDLRILEGRYTFCL